MLVRNPQLSLNVMSICNSTGNVVNIQTGQWVGKQSGLGAGMDSFYEYLLKSYILFGEKEDYGMFQAAYESIQNHLRRGWVPLKECDTAACLKVDGCVCSIRGFTQWRTWNVKLP